MVDLWGPVVPTEFKFVRFVSGRLATEEDVRLGAAVFYLQPTKESQVPARPHAMKLPACALHRDGDQTTPIVVIQAEAADGRVIVGARPLAGGNMVCLLSEIEPVEPSDPRFVTAS